MDLGVMDEIVEFLPFSEGGIELDQRFGDETGTAEGLLDHGLDARVLVIRHLLVELK